MSSRSAALALLLLAAGLQLSACWVKELKGIRNDWDSRWSGAKQEDHVLLEDALKSLPHVSCRDAGRGLSGGEGWRHYIPVDV